ncbi:MAG: GNAT family N-acetyltransferase [Bacteroidales bacterium]|jgi:ribosomal protein S18 acetylase RimI-like enzyme|nr:GNAT family N-acetyltransferase [Bacteroidales bacterium]
MDIIIKRLEETPVTYEEIVDLMHDSFKERLEQGLHFTSCTMSVDDFKRKYSDGVIIVGFDKATGEMMAFYTFHLRRDKKNISFGYLEQLAVSPKAKRSGIGSKMLAENCRIASSMGAHYMLSDTACKATSSVLWHYKNGFYKYELESYRSTNYWSFVFIKYLDDTLKVRPLMIKFHYGWSWLFIRATRHKNGSDTTLGLLFKKIKSKCKS